MFDFILNYWDSILIVALFILFLLALIKKGAVQQVNEILFYLAIKAEERFGGGTGALKYAAVTTWLYERLPAIVKILFTSKQIDLLIENAVIRMKKYLDTNYNARVLME